MAKDDENDTTDGEAGAGFLVPFESGDEAGEHGEADGLDLDAGQEEEIQRVFLTTLPQYMEPVEEMIDKLVADGDESGEITQALAATLTSLSAAAERLEVDNVYRCLRRMSDRANQLVSIEPGAEADSAALFEDLRWDLDEIKKIVAGVGGDADSEPKVRSPTIFAALKDVGGVDGVDERALGKLTQAGVVNVEQLRGARLDEITAVSGLDAAVVEKILEALNIKKKVVEMPLALGTLRAQLDKKLKAQVDAEAALDEMQAKVQRLRTHTESLGQKLAAAEEDSTNLGKSLAMQSDRHIERVARLGEVRAARLRIVQKNADADKMQQEEEESLQDLRAQHKRATAEGAEFDDGVETLIKRIQGMIESTLRR